MSIISKALVFATTHHQYQHRKGTRFQYMSHLLQHETTTDQLLVSGADKLDNLCSIGYDLERIGEKIWSRFNASKEQ